MSLAGNIAEVAIALQAVKGTPAATAQHRMRITGGLPGVVRESQDIIESTGQRMLEGSFVASVRFEGAPVFIGRPTFLFLLAYAALGAKAVTGAADPYTHTATLAITLPWLTVWCQLANGQYVRATDCKVVKLRIESSAGGTLMVSCTIMGRTPVTVATATYTTHMGAIVVETANPYLHADASGGLKVEGVAVTRIERAMVEVDNSGAVQYGDAITPEDISVARQTVTAEVVENIIDFALYNRLIYGSATPADLATVSRDPLELAGNPAGLDFKWTRPGTPARTLEVLVPRVVLASVGGLEYNADGNPIKQTAAYRAFRPASGSGLTVIAQNGQASYPAL